MRTEYLLQGFFIFCGATAQPSAPRFLRFLDHTPLDTHTHTHTHTVGLLWASDQLVTEAAT